MYTLQKSSRPNKKFMVTTNIGNIIHFGAKGYNDFIIYSRKNPLEANKRKISYLARHSVRENLDDPSTAGFWSANILWNKPTLQDSINDTSKKYKIKITNNIKN